MPRIVKSIAAALLVHGAAADAHADAVASSLSDLQKAAPVPTTYSNHAATTAHVSNDAAGVVGGMTEAFLGTRKISAEESHCLANGASTLAAAITQSCGDAVDSFRSATAALQTTTLEPVMIANGTLQNSGSAFPWLPTSSTVAPLTGGEETVITLEFAARFAGILDLERQLAKQCLHDDAVKTLETAADHMGNLTYVGGHVIANGVDILTELTDAAAAFDAGNFRRFGQDLGGAWRKVVLSKKSDMGLEMPSEAGIEEMTQSLMASLFGNGLSLQIETDGGMSMTTPMLRGSMYGSTMSAGQPGQAPANPVQPALPVQPAMTAPATVQQPGYPYPSGPQTINIDLRNCLVVNMPLFESAWAPVLKLFQDAASKEAAEAALSDMSALVMSMFDLQLALRMCGLGPYQEAALLDGMKAGTVHTKLDLPEVHSMSPQQERDSMSKAFAEALQDWKLHSWAAFGGQLGSILRDMMVVMFPAKYSVDDLGRLRTLLADSKHVSIGKVAAPGVNVGLFVVFAMVVVSGVVLAYRRAKASHVLLNDGSEMEPVVE
eukprot:TRINITY_DN8547_c0_g2_i1.p1 TRINITY_DN8547_c0_g2~~TRINITY_DN8547_c0_g2_i1.p1  ORF type:complete len:549 (+),score=135.85 TRINITY_DN8547_c0_g2_i1:116-1762(+)